MIIRQKLKALQRIAQSERDEDKIFLQTSPLLRATEFVQKQIDIAAAYRVNILRNLKLFEKMSQFEIDNAAHSMEELFFSQGDTIIRQDDLGDAMYVIEEGLVTITTKSNPRDMTEQPHLLATVGKNSLFGERSLMTKEPRSATVTVVSDYAKILRMTKDTFDAIIETSNKLAGATRDSIAKDVVRRLPLLKNFTSAEKEEVFRAMISVPFAAGNYVFRQGAVGNHFYIVTEGVLSVTLSNEKGKEREVGKLHPGDYFGELALLGTTSRRTANVFVVESCNLMQLSRADFGKFLGNLKDELLQNQSAKHVKLPKRKNAISFTGKRRISGYGTDNIPKETLMGTLTIRLLKFFTISIWNSLYSRLFRELLLIPGKSVEFGSLTAKLHNANLSRPEAVAKIGVISCKILEKEHESRTIEENMFVAGLFHQRNDLKNKVASGWPSHRFNELCKRITYQKAVPMQKIIEAGLSGTKAYLILRGCVRVFSEITDEATGRTTTFYLEDLTSGDIFGESALGGIFKRTITVVATHFCDLGVIDSQDYMHVLEGGARKLSVEEKCNFLNIVPLFKNVDFYGKFEIAHHLTQVEFERGQRLIERGKVANALMIVIDGRIDFVAPKSNSIISSTERFAYIGESGILSFKYRSKAFVDTFDGVAATHIECLLLPESYYHLVDTALLDQMRDAFFSKLAFRKGRKQELKYEQRELRQQKKARELASAVRELEVLSLHNNNNSNSTPADAGAATTNSSLSLPMFARPRTTADSGVAPVFTNLARSSSAPFLATSRRPTTTQGSTSRNNTPQNRQLFSATINVSRPSTALPVSTFGTFYDTAQSRPKTALPAASRTIAEKRETLEDMPEILNGSCDPLLATATMRNKKEVRKLRESLSRINSRRTERAKVRNALHYRKVPFTLASGGEDSLLRNGSPVRNESNLFNRGGEVLVSPPSRLSGSARIPYPQSNMNIASL